MHMVLVQSKLRPKRSATLTSLIGIRMVNSAVGPPTQVDVCVHNLSAGRHHISVMCIAQHSSPCANILRNALLFRILITVEVARNPQLVLQEELRSRVSSQYSV